VKNEEGNSQQ